MADDTLLQVRNLKTSFFLDEGVLRAVDGITFDIRRGETLGLIGESGCGKSVTAQSILRIVPAPRGKIVAGSILYHPGNGAGGKPVDLVRLNPKGEAIRGIRGKEISMIFQEPMTSFGPMHTIGNQISEAILLHNPRLGRDDARRKAIALLGQVGIARPEMLVDSYPYQFSGGMLQRAMIAMALSCSPKLLIADEATTYLDVTIQAQILELMRELHNANGMSILLITHNLAVVSQLADRVAVMYLGKIVESGSMRAIFKAPLHPYTQGLWRSIPRVDGELTKLTPIPGVVPKPSEPIPGCVFASRCEQLVGEVCRKGGDPPAIEVEPQHFVSCHRYGKGSA